MVTRSYLTSSVGHKQKQRAGTGLLFDLAMAKTGYATTAQITMTPMMVTN
jgi:hypothetical protein